RAAITRRWRSGGTAVAGRQAVRRASPRGLASPGSGTVEPAADGHRAGPVRGGWSAGGRWGGVAAGGRWSAQAPPLTSPLVVTNLSGRPSSYGGRPFLSSGHASPPVFGPGTHGI